jgi:hypothetical protein
MTRVSSVPRRSLAEARAPDPELPQVAYLERIISPAAAW